MLANCCLNLSVINHVCDMVTSATQMNFNDNSVRIMFHAGLLILTSIHSQGQFIMLRGCRVVCNRSIERASSFVFSGLDRLILQVGAGDHSKIVLLWLA